MKIGTNTIGIAENYLTKNSAVLRQATAEDIANHKNSDNSNSFDVVELDKMKEMLGRTIGDANFNYTKEDAVQAAWNKETALNINIYEDNSDKIVRLGSFTPPTNFASKLEQNGISNQIDWFMKDFNFKNLSEDKIVQSIDFLSSQYAVMKEHIQGNFKGEELKNELSKLNETINTHKNKIANAFADKIGDFFEEGGATEEKQKIYQSIQNEFDSQVKKYEEFLQSNNDYAGINGTKDEWLKNDTNYMASELRKTLSSSKNVKPVSNGESYSLDELQAVGDMVDEAKSYGYGAYDHNRTQSGSEEKIGLNLAELSIKTAVFNKNSNVSLSLKNALSASVNKFINDTIDEVDAEYKKKSDEAKISEDKNGYAPLDKNAINAVIDKVMSSYEKTGSVSKAMKDRTAFAVDRFNSKRDDNGKVYRYKGNAFHNFFQFSKPEPVFNMKPIPYYEEKAEIENIITNFNSFIDKFSLGIHNRINKSDFSTFA